MNIKEIKGSQKVKEYVESIILNNKHEYFKLPSERQLSTELSVSRNSVRNALRELYLENKIITEPCSGSYCLGKKYTRNLLGVNNLTTTIRQSGFFLKTNIISMKKLIPDKTISDKLKIKNELVYEIIRLRKINDIPGFIETLYISVNRCPNLEKYYSELSSIYYIYQNIYDISLVGGTEKISITYPTIGECKLLNINQNLPLFFSSGITFDETKAPVEYYKIVFRSDLFIFSYLIENIEYKRRNVYE